MSKRNPEAGQLVIIGALSGLIMAGVSYLAISHLDDEITFKTCDDTETVAVTPKQDSANYNPKTDPKVLSEFSSGDYSLYLAEDIRNSGIEHIICLNEVSLTFNLNNDGKALSDLYSNSTQS